MSSIPDILDALKTRLESTGVEVFSYVPDSPVLPSICLYFERWPYDPTEDATFVALCIAGNVDSQDAQTKMNGWLSDTGDTSITAAIDDDNQLGGVVSSVLPLEVRTPITPVLDAAGKRYLQAEFVLQILR